MVTCVDWYDAKYRELANNEDIVKARCESHESIRTWLPEEKEIPNLTLCCGSDGHVSVAYWNN